MSGEWIMLVGIFSGPSYGHGTGFGPPINLCFGLRRNQELIEGLALVLIDFPLPFVCLFRSCI